jgi:PAS domain S-box-containing protein
MLNSLRFNIYFFFLIFTAIGLLWFFNFISNRTILKQEIRQSEVFRLHNRFSKLVLAERKVAETGSDYTTILEREKAFFQQCTQCHAQKTTLPDERIAILARRNELLRTIAAMRDEARKHLSELFASVHYIHEHHIVFLQNYLDYVRFGSSDTSQDKLWKIYADEAVKEPEIVRKSVNIQYQIANIIYDFGILSEGAVSDKVQNDFVSHIKGFYQSVNRFETLSIDAQDGLFVEELLEQGRLLERKFNRLFKLAMKNNELVQLLSNNRKELDRLFVIQETMLRQRQLTMMQQLAAINWGSFMLAVFLGILFLLRARKLLCSIDELVEQTRRLGSDITYRIPEKTSVPEELAVLRAILNKLARSLSRQIENLNEEIENRRRIEQEKESYAAYLDSILSSSNHTAIVAADIDLCIKYFNPEAERMFGVKKQDIMGKDIHVIHSRFTDESIRKKSFNHVLDKVRGGTVHPFRFEIGEITIDARLSAIRNRDGELSGYLLMANDITEWLAAEKQREIMSRRLQKAEKMEAIGLMAGGVAHDLNNILSGIINYPDLMLMQLDGDDKWRKSLEAIKASGLRAAAIVADLLTIARGVACEKQVCAINELIAAYLDTPEYRRLALRHPDVVLKTDLDDKLRPCLCSSVHIQKMLMNLVSNAFEAIEETGEVIIATANVSLDEYGIVEYGLEAGDYISITVRDTGKGITDEDAMHVFEPFYTRKKMGRSGTGLGLAVVWNTVQDHLGTVTIQNMSPGTAFVVLLPACGDEKLSDHSHEPDERTEGTGHILVVDDEPILRDVARQMLEALGYDVATADNGRDAIKYVREHEVDLVIMDMVMEPDMNGRQALEEILKFKPEQRTLIASGFADNEEIQKACSLGRTSLLHKPYTINKLAAAVRDALDG